MQLQGSVAEVLVLSFGIWDLVPQPEIKPTLPAVEAQSLSLPGSSVIRIQRFHCGGLGLLPGQGTKIPQATRIVAFLFKKIQLFYFFFFGTAKKIFFNKII